MSLIDSIRVIFFESFDWWAQYGAGAESDSSNMLQNAYAERTQEYRRYLTMLEAHGVSVHQHLPGLDDAQLKDSFLMEESMASPLTDASPVTEHTTNELGIIAVTVVSGERQINFYPLLPSGLNDIHQFIQDQGFSGDIAYPGRICYDDAKRQLIADTLPC